MIPCPRCRSSQAVYQHKIVSPDVLFGRVFSRTVGHAYGCLRCRLGYGVLNSGETFAFGDKAQTARTPPREEDSVQSGRRNDHEPVFSYPPPDEDAPWAR